METDPKQMDPKAVTYGWVKYRGGYLSHLWQTYRLTGEMFDTLWERQDENKDGGALCAGCAAELAHPLRKIIRFGLKCEVDHSHKTGRVRGLLCRGCNDFLGKIKDNENRMRRLSEYLKRNGEDIV